MTNEVDHHHYMIRALQLARNGLYTTAPNPRVGCVIVNQGQVIGEGYHHSAGKAHAEINALNVAQQDHPGLVRDATVYVTLEPCSHHGKTPPCAEALVHAEVGEVIIAMQDPNPDVSGQGIVRLQQAGIQTSVGIQAREAEALNPGFLKRMRQGIPYVRLKIASSLDGRTAMASGESQWITGEAARQDGHRYRARADAILTGVNTVLTDNPSLTARLESTDIEIKQPLCVILDSELKTPLDTKVLQHPGGVLIYTLCQDEKRILEYIAYQNVSVISLQGKRIDLLTVMQDLARQAFNEVHIEAGATLSTALLEANLVDEVVHYIAPNLMGSDATPLFTWPLKSMKEVKQLELQDVRSVGKDIRLRYRMV